MISFPSGPSRFSRLTLLLAWFGACTSANAPPTGEGADGGVLCRARLPTTCVEPAPRYADVRAIFATRCATATCHDGRDEDGPWPLLTYNHSADWADLIRDEMAKCSMPPPESGLALTTQESDLILRWLRCGYLE